MRTPLNSIIGFSQVLEDGLYGELNEKQKEYMADVLRSSRHLLDMITDLLDLSRAASDSMELELSRFFLKDVLKSSVAVFIEKAVKHHLKLSLEMEPEADIEIEADSVKLNKIMFNLLSNAVKFTPDGGSVRVSARLISDVGAIRRVAQEEGRGSAGVGLILTKKLIELHEGKIWFESEHGKGSRFTFMIPFLNSGS